MNTGKTDAELWRGTPEDFELHSRKQECVTADRLESALVNSRHPTSADCSVHGYRPGPHFTNDALDFFGTTLTDEDPAAVDFVREVERRRYFDVRVRPGTLIAQYLAYRREPKLTSRATRAWHLFKRSALAQAAGYVPIHELTPRLREVLDKLKTVAG